MSLSFSNQLQVANLPVLAREKFPWFFSHLHQLALFPGFLDSSCLFKNLETQFSTTLSSQLSYFPIYFFYSTKRATFHFTVSVYLAKTSFGSKFYGVSCKSKERPSPSLHPGICPAPFMYAVMVGPISLPQHQIIFLIKN